MNARIHVSLGAAAVALLLPLAAHAIDPAYAKKLERSGCTQISEGQGCDINKTKAENAKAGFGKAPTAMAGSPYAGQWFATNAGSGQVVATIRVDKNNKVTVDGKPVAARIKNGAMQFKVGFILYTLQSDPRLPNENTWWDQDAQTTGPIRRK